MNIENKEFEKYLVRADGLAVGGSSICTSLDSKQTKKLFIPMLIPGEQALVQIKKESQGFLEGEITEILEQSSSRQTPPCEYFGRCGGCQLQHMTIQKERELKLEMISSYFERQAKLLPIKLESLSDALPEFHYRRRITLHLSHTGLVGFHKPGTSQVLPINNCLLAEKPILDVLHVIQRQAEALSQICKAVEISNENGIFFILHLRDFVTPAKISENKRLLESILKEGQLYGKGKQKTYKISKRGTQISVEPHTGSAGHFSQVNRYGNEVLQSAVKKYVSELQFTTLSELYAGSGNFTFLLSEFGKAFTAVEFDSQLVTAGQKESKDRGLDGKIKFVQASCESYVRRNKLEQLVVMDPPRAGAKDVVKLANWSNTTDIIYISCNLPSLARDVASIVKYQGFSFEKLSFVDMFPRTHHVEMIAYLKRK